MDTNYRKQKDEDENDETLEPRVYFNEERHRKLIVPEYNPNMVSQWRIKDRMKTISVALVLCLNIGVDPPDIVKTVPCAKLECWIDPFTQPPARALEAIGKALQTNYEMWQPRARYKPSLDPTAEDVKKLCTALRRNAKDDRILFHYNGHGVPKPTTNGEIWVFNKNFTQYIPLSVYDLQTWMGSPSIFVYDCSAAGNIVNSFIQFAEQREKEFKRMMETNPQSTNQIVQPVPDCIQLGACKANQVLPMHPDLPADLFTSCLTTPIEIAIRWFVLQNRTLTNIPLDIYNKIPGLPNDRRTPKGELIWIFTAITDTIAWNMLPKDLFQKLFRQDLLVASLFRNFLLAERILRSYNCTPVSSPKLPACYQHPMWQAWDLAAELCLAQIPAILENPGIEYSHSLFFTEQLTAFEVWLEQGASNKSPPQQLPIVLQVLLSQVHRLRALNLLGRFLDLGPWAVSLALSVGIFPYVLKLLQSPASELRKILVHIWARILAVDRSCQADLVKDAGHKYFVQVLLMPTISSEERSMAAFVLATVCRDYKLGKQACLKSNILPQCSILLSDPDPVTRQWVALLLGELWNDHGEAKRTAIREGIHEKIQTLLVDPVCEVRAAVTFAIGKFFGGLEKSDSVIATENSIVMALPIATADCSTLARRELVIALSAFVTCYEAEFRQIAMEEEEQRQDRKYRRRIYPISSFISVGRALQAGIHANAAVCQCVWKMLINLSLDPHPDIYIAADTVIEVVLSNLNSATDAITPIVAPETGARLNTPSQPQQTRTLRKSLSQTPNSSRLSTGSVQSRSPMTPANSSSNELVQEKNSTMNLPLNSNIFDWSSEYFRTPKQSANDNAESNLMYQRRIWRQSRNEKIREESRELYNNATYKKLDEQVAILDNEGEIITQLKFHPYEPKLVAVDEEHGVCVWNLDEGVKINAFRNNAPGTRTTSLTFINEEDNPLLLTGSDDGVVKIWRNWESPKRNTLVTAWRALTDLIPSSRGSGLVTEWQQNQGTLLVSGDARIIRFWDIERELCVQDIPTFSDSCITTLTSEQQMGNIVVAGCGDGAVRIYDRRLPARDSMIANFYEHRSWIVNVAYQNNGRGHLISGSVGGDIKFWDIRSPFSTKTVEAHHGGMTTLAAHNYCPLFATGSNNQCIKVFNTNGDLLNMIRYHDGFLGQRIGPVSSAIFHPYKVLLAAGSTDSMISLYSNDSYS